MIDTPEHRRTARMLRECFEHQQQPEESLNYGMGMRGTEMPDSPPERVIARDEW